ncbi:MAG: pyridoxal-5'-phosphate-dependent protein subunit beta [Myxococcales bacterium]|nr:pyridoxal-5'-phosphate-dependent protein subunit beta [Myxococcales bacterium]
MATLGLENEVVDATARKSSVAQLKSQKVYLPTTAQLADPSTIPAEITEKLADIDPDEPHPLNLFRVHWFNDADRRTKVAVPNHVVLPKELTGVDAKVVVLFGNRFPMINAHKVLAAYGCLIPRLVTGQFDAGKHRAIWPSTGNYCRGGVAISKLLGCRGVAVLPEGMSEERFSWLDKWTNDPSDTIRTVGTESNVKEIYDKCNELSQDDQNLIFNQFCEFGNYLVHYNVTGTAFKTVFEHLKSERSDLNLAALVSATGSAGTIAAGDKLKECFGTKIVAAEALECPTMLYNGFGEHNIQGIGDKHLPFIQNVTNSDVVVAVSDRGSDTLNLLFQTDEGRAELKSRGVSDDVIEALRDFGLSSNANVLSAIKTAKKLGLGADDVVMTVATDGGAMYSTELGKAKEKYFEGKFDASLATRVYDEELANIDDDDVMVMNDRDRNRVFNLGYFTWVEQQGVSVEEFEARRSQDFWVGLRKLIPIWDKMIEEFNAESGVEI